MSSIRVKPTDLATASSRIHDAMVVASEVRSRNSALYHEAAAAGRGDVESAIHEFMNAWSFGLQHLIADGTTLADYLGIAASAYEKVDDDIASVGSHP